MHQKKTRVVCVAKQTAPRSDVHELQWLVLLLLLVLSLSSLLHAATGRPWLQIAAASDRASSLGTSPVKPRRSMFVL